MSNSSLEHRLSRFACRRCGACCKGDGVVGVKPSEVGPIARALDLNPEEFIGRYAIPTAFDDYWLIDQFVNGERWCVFLERGEGGVHGCRIQSAKPAQCREFPYTWRRPDVLEWCMGFRDEKNEGLRMKD